MCGYAVLSNFPPETARRYLEPDALARDEVARAVLAAPETAEDGAVLDALGAVSGKRLEQSPAFKKGRFPARAAYSRRPGGRGAARSLPRASGTQASYPLDAAAESHLFRAATRIPTRITRSTAPALTAAAAAIGGRCGMSRCTLTTKSCARFCARRTAACAGR